MVVVYEGRNARTRISISNLVSVDGDMQSALGERLMWRLAAALDTEQAMCL
jgi:hypothetical protein